MKAFEVEVLGEDLKIKEMVIAEFRPIKCYVLPKGSLEDKPSFCFILVDSKGRKFGAQISQKMLREGFKEVGFEL